MNRSGLRLLVLLLLSSALLAACGSGAQSAADTSATGQAAATQPPASDGSRPSEPATARAGELIFTIVPGESEARFKIDEVLAGSPNLVVGTTSDVQGEIRVDPLNPDGASVGPIVIGADSLATDNNFRNRAIASFILQSGDYPAITFTPEMIEGLPATVSVGDTFSFKVAGQLTIRDITQPVTFDVSVQIESESQISGTAQATIRRADFDLTIPSVPQVASVSEQVLLELGFVASSGG
jgi:polyisoprenoid-binding protein YceI